MLGRRRLLAGGLGLFAVASVGCGLARWPAMLIGSRVIQGVAGALFTTSQQTGAAVGLAILATAAAARTAHASGSLTAGYRLSFLIASALAAIAAALVALLVRSRDCQRELARQRSAAGGASLPMAEAQLRKC